MSKPKNTKRITIDLSIDQHDKLKKMAREYGGSMQAFLRDKIDNFIVEFEEQEFLNISCKDKS